MGGFGSRCCGSGAFGERFCGSGGSRRGCCGSFGGSVGGGSFGRNCGNGEVCGEILRFISFILKVFGCLLRQFFKLWSTYILVEVDE